MHLFNQIAQKPNIVYVSPSMIDDRIEAIYYKQQYLDADEKIVSFDTGYVFLKDLCSKITDGTHKTPNYTTKGLKFISSKNVSEDGIDFENVKYISKEEHHEISKRCKVEAEDILLTKVGRIGYAKIVPANVPDFSIFVSVALLKLKGNMDNAFIEVFLNSKYGRIQSEKLAKGSNQPDFHLEDIAEIKIPIPSPEIQEYIGDKVRKAEELREEAKRLIKEAEEILEKELGINSLNKGIVKYHWVKGFIVDDRIDSDFYDLKYQVLIEIEKEFNCYLMEDIIIDKYTGKTPDKSYEGLEGIPLIVVKNIEENNINLSNIERRIKDNSNFRKTEENDLLITRVGSVGVTSIVEENEKGLFISDNVICLKLKEGLYRRYIAFYLNSIYGKLMVERWTKGAVQGVINYQSINKFKIPILDGDIMGEIDLRILKWKQQLTMSKQLIQEAKQDVEDLIEGNFDMSKIKVNN